MARLGVSRALWRALATAALVSVALGGCSDDNASPAVSSSGGDLPPGVGSGQYAYGCSDIAYTNIPADGDYYLTSFGCCGTMACGESTGCGSWYYAADEQRYGCGARVSVTNPANGACVVVETDDCGPSKFVEDDAGGPVLDASPLVAGALFGVSGAGWSDHFLVHVVPVAASTPLGRCAAPTPPYDATWAGQSYPSDMTSGDTVSAYLEYHNTGTKTWDSNTRVGTTVPRDRASVFAASDWIGPSRPTAVDRSTPPGSVGRFTFNLHAPEVAKDTTYTEHWGLVQEGVTWFGPPDGNVWFKITVHPRYTADYVSERYPSDMVSGQVAMAEIDMKNTGSTTWDTTGTRLGTQGPQDRASDFYDPVSWTNASRPTAVAASTAPGAVGHFYFTLRAPMVQEDTTYVEHWGIVQEGVTWVKTPNVYFTITVHPPAVSRPAPVAPAAAGSAPAPYVSGGCSATPGAPSGDAPAVLLVLAILGLAARRRRAR